MNLVFYFLLINKVNKYCLIILQYQKLAGIINQFAPILSIEKLENGQV